MSVAAFARSCGFLPDEVRDVEIAVGEAIANAVEHGNKSAGSFSLCARFEGGLLAIEVKDGGSGFLPDAPAEPKAYRGWGILLMRHLVDSISFHDGGTRVRLEKRRISQGRSDLDSLERAAE